MLKIAVTGAESTGKSTLCKALALHYKTVWVEEYARQYLENLGRKYTQADILYIAQQQKIAYESQKEQAHDIIFCDTELLVTKIWAENAFGSCPDWIETHLPQQDFDFYLLMYIDLPWQYDKLREHPHKRVFFWEWYERELTKLQFPYFVIKGSEEERTQNAIAVIENWKAKYGIASNLR